MRREALRQAVFLILLAAIVSAPSLANGFAYDDLPIIRDNPRVHELLAPWTYATQSYWPPSHGGFLYRPLVVWLFAAEWAIGGGSPVPFHLANVLLNIATVLAVYFLARRIVPPAWACVGAAIFAVHPVHAEAVANVVGQAELLMGLAATLSVGLYIRARQTGTLGSGSRLVITLLAVVAALAKEQGFVVPALLGLAELTIAGRQRRNWRELAALGVLLGAALSALLAARTVVLHGLGGGATATTIQGLDAGDRALTMLAMVPTLFRLMVWPAHLRADYSPPEFAAVTQLGPAHIVGLALLATTAAGAWLIWRAGERGAVFGLGWTALALLPVSNLLFPTGVLIAERTLYLPSVGVVIALASGARLLAQRLAPHPRFRLTGASLGALLLLTGAVHSAARQRSWRDGSTLFPQMIRDSPRGYRAHLAYARFLREQGRPADAEAELRIATELYAGDALAYLELGQILRAGGRCKEAIPLFDRAATVAGEFELVLAQSRSFECRMAIGDYAGARQTIAGEAAAGRHEFARMLARADSALAVQAAAARKGRGALDQSGPATRR
jgi:protein O-mannosyl-transferase